MPVGGDVQVCSQTSGGFHTVSVRNPDALKFGFQTLFRCPKIVLRKPDTSLDHFNITKNCYFQNGLD